MIISTRLNTALGSISISNFLFGFEFVGKLWDKLGKFCSFVVFSDISILFNLDWTSFDDTIFISGAFILFFLLFVSFSFLLLSLCLSIFFFISFFSLDFSFELILFSSLFFFEKIFSARLSVFSNFFLSSSNSFVFNTKLFLFFFSLVFFSFVIIFCICSFDTFKSLLSLLFSSEVSEKFSILFNPELTNNC